MQKAKLPGGDETLNILYDLPVTFRLRSVPSAFEPSVKSLGQCFKLWFEKCYVADSKTGYIGTRKQFLTNRAVFDFSKLELSELDPNKIMQDLELIREFVAEHPEELLQLISALQEARVDDAQRIVETYRLTEKDMGDRGGGFAHAAVLILAIAIAALVDAACRSNGGDAGSKDADKGYKSYREEHSDGGLLSKVDDPTAPESQPATQPDAGDDEPVS